MRKILVSAYGCEPNKGSEPGVGWQWVMEMSKTEELWVITRSNNEESINSVLTVNQRGRIHFIYYDLPDMIKKIKIKIKEKGLYPYYFLWQVGAYLQAKRLLSTNGFDYCIHLSFGSMWMPTFMYKLPIPFIWGPIGGGESVPFNLIKTLPWKTRIPQYLRCLLIRTVTINPFFIGPCRTARAIVTRTDDSRKVFPEKYQSKVSVMLETGMSAEMLQDYTPSNCSNGSNVLELVYVGRLVAIKNVETAIRAIASVQSDQPNVCLTIVGDGPLKSHLMSLAQRLNVQNKINFMGTVTQQQAISVMQRSHVFLFPSLKEGGTWSLMEAMAVGLPVICLDTSGMHIITDDSCAIRIPPTTPKDTIQKMADAIKLLAGSPELRQQMGSWGRRRIQEEFLWSNKGIFMFDLFSGLDN